MNNAALVLRRLLGTIAFLTLLLTLLDACSTVVSDDDSPSWPNAYNKNYARVPFFLGKPGWGSTPILYFCEYHRFAHDTAYHLLVDKRDNELRLPWRDSKREIFTVEDPQSNPWAYLEMGAMEAVNWSQWSTLLFAVRFYDDPVPPSYPLKLELRWGEDLESWQAAPFVEAKLEPIPEEGNPYEIEGKLKLVSPLPETIGPVFSFRVSLYDPNGLGNYFRFYEARWQRAEIPTHDFFDSVDCGPDFP